MRLTGPCLRTASEKNTTSSKTSNMLPMPVKMRSRRSGGTAVSAANDAACSSAHRFSASRLSMRSRIRLC